MLLFFPNVIILYYYVLLSSEIILGFVMLVHISVLNLKCISHIYFLLDQLHMSLQQVKVDFEKKERFK